MKEGYQQALKNLTLLFLLKTFPFTEQDYEKQKRPRASDQSLFSLKKVQKIPLLVIYITCPSLMMYHELDVELFQKLHLLIYVSQFMASQLFHLHLSFWIWKVWTGREKITKIRIFRVRKELFWWNKKHFSVFDELPLKKLKIADTSFQDTLNALFW